MLTQIQPFLQKPTLFQPGSAALWQDDHISKGMLQAHLSPAQDGATRNHAFVRASVEWLARTLPPTAYPNLLDLGCGPGLYAEGFWHKGYKVTGLDISPRSIRYARRQAQKKQLGIHYQAANYLDMAYTSRFNLATLIYCDYGALPPAHRKRLLQRVYNALTPQGAFVLDAFTPRKYKGVPETKTWGYHNGGFYKPVPYLSLNAFYRYNNENAFLDQHLVFTHTAETADCYHIWTQTFTPETLAGELQAAGFAAGPLLGDIAGAPYTPISETICMLAYKR